MPKKIERLSETRVAKETKAGLYADGAGLYLRIGAVARRAGPSATCWRGPRGSLCSQTDHLTHRQSGDLGDHRQWAAGAPRR